MLAVLTALAAALLPALFLAPHLLAARGAQDGFADQDTLAGTVRDVFVEYWGPATGPTRRTWTGWSATGSHSQCSCLQAGGEANPAVALRRSRTLLRDGDGSLTRSQ
ncbi:hypothetical protein ACFZDK_47415 [Streptomyces sp. NPDC007901]|uniref:hypothetical protein n=1 Tax=Streptomyces sp. NPDC007901 TaxID=3364785 RepID=UPI0036E53169